MKKKIILHLVWGVIAFTAYVFGSQHTKTDGSEISGSSEDFKPLSNRHASPADPADEEERPGSKSSRRIDGDQGSSATLNEVEIAELAQEFRTGDLVERRIAFAEMLKNLTPENALLMRESIADLPQDSPEFREFHYAWGAVAGQEAIAHGKQTGKRDMAASLAGWASADPSSAMAYFDSLTPAEQNGGSLMKWGAAYGLADADPQLATEFAVERNQNGDKDAGKMIDIAATAILRDGDHEVATDWAKKIPEGDMQNKAFQRLGTEYAKEDPAKAVEWAVELPNGEGRDHAVGSSFHQWAGKSPEEAATAINSLPAADRDAAIYGFATRAVHDDPAVGVEWAANIRDSEARTSALIDTGRVFMKREPEAAREWLASANLPEKAVQKITGGK